MSRGPAVHTQYTSTTSAHSDGTPFRRGEERGPSRVGDSRFGRGGGLLLLGDSLALDQALLANYTLLNDMGRNARLKSRLMRRRPSRVVRGRRAEPAPPPSSPTRPV